MLGEAARPAPTTIASRSRGEVRRASSSSTSASTAPARATARRALAVPRAQTAPTDVAVSKARIVCQLVDPDRPVRLVDVLERNPRARAGASAAPCSGHSTKATVPSKYGSRSPHSSESSP